MTVQQVDKPATRTGDPCFMQNLNDAWHRVDDNTGASLGRCVHLSGSGDVVRIDAIKDHQSLKPSFAPLQTAGPTSALAHGEATQTMQTTATNHPPDKATWIFRSPTAMVTPHHPR